jgi:hypothetical protein
MQTAISVAKECGILSPDETVISVSVFPAIDKNQPEIYFNIQGIPQLVWYSFLSTVYSLY